MISNIWSFDRRPLNCFISNHWFYLEFREIAATLPKIMDGDFGRLTHHFILLKINSNANNFFRYFIPVS